MKSITTQEFEQEDLKLLRNELPDNPCQKCSPVERAVCCGCPDERAYAAIVKKYKDRNLYDFACLIKERSELKYELDKVTRRCTKRIVELDAELVEVDKFLSSYGTTKNVDAF